MSHLRSRGLFPLVCRGKRGLCCVSVRSYKELRLSSAASILCLQSRFLLFLHRLCACRAASSSLACFTSAAVSCVSLIASASAAKVSFFFSINFASIALPVDIKNLYLHAHRCARMNFRKLAICEDPGHCAQTRGSTL